MTIICSVVTHVENIFFLTTPSELTMFDNVCCTFVAQSEIIAEKFRISVEYIIASITN